MRYSSPVFANYLFSAMYGILPKMATEVLRINELLDWFEGLTTGEKLEIDSLIQRIQEHGHFGDVKNIGDAFAELRWKNGRRIYFTRVGQIMILLLSGGLKNAQKKDIKKARVLVERYAGFKT